MKGNRNSVNEKSYASIKDYITPTESPEAIALKYKATFFLAVIRSITKAFGPILNGFNAERYHAFRLQMALYTNRCLDLQSGSPTITRLWNNAPKRARENDVEENKKLDGDIENFYYRIAKFFEGCNASIQQKILDALETEIDEGVDEQDSKERLQEILKKLRFHKKMGELDNFYIPTADEILNTYIIGAAIPSIDGLFPLIIKPVAKARRNSVKALFFPDEQSSLKKPQEQVNPKEIDIQEITTALSDEDIYKKIDKSIKSNLFSGEVCQHNRVQKQFSEIFEMEISFLNFFESIIEEELPYIKEKIALNGEQKRFIGEFVKKLTSCFETQKELCKRMEECRANFHLDELGTVNQNAIHIFLEIYEEHNLKKQTNSFLQLMDDWFKFDELLAEHKKSLTRLVEKREIETLKDFEKYQQELTKELQEHNEENDRLLKVRLREDEQKRILPTIAYAQRYALSSRVAQICTRRIMISTEVLESLKLDDLSSVELERVQEQYKFLCYLCNQYNLVLNIRQDGYICPEDLDVLLKSHFDAKERYSLAYFLIQPREKQALEELKKLKKFKEAFLSFARRFDGNESRIQFFEEIFELFQKKPLLLRDLEFLRTYVTGNPLRLNSEILASIKGAFESNEPNAAIKIKNIIKSLIPVIADVSSQLNRTLKQFQLSPDAIDVLLTVPDIKEKVGDKSSLAALDKEDIANLPSFWRDIFVSEEGALRKSLTQKKGQWSSDEARANIPASIKDILEPFLDSELSIDYDQFIEKRKCIAQDLFVIEVEKQIKLLGGEEGIFSDKVLTMLTSRMQDKVLPDLLQELPKANEQFFLFYYAEAILQIRYILIQMLAKYFEKKSKRIEKTDDVIENSSIFSSNFSPNTKDTALDLESLITLLKETQRNRPHFHKSEKTTSAFRVFDLVKEKARPGVYQKLKEEIKTLSETKLSKTDQNSIKIRMSDGNNFLTNGRPNQNITTPFRTPAVKNPQNEELQSSPTSPYSTPTRTVEATGSIDFKRLVSELDTVAQAKQLQLKKYIRFNALVSKECFTPNSKANCNSLKVLKSDESKQLLLTAQSSGKDCSVTIHCHEKELVAKTVAAMAKSISRRDTVATLEIDIKASAAEVPLLINQYVTQTLEQKLLPKVIVNGVVLKPEELGDKLDKPLAQEYNKIKDALEQCNLSRNRMGHFATRSNDKQSTARRLFQDQTDKKPVILSERK